MANKAEIYSSILNTTLNEDHTSWYNDRLFGWIRNHYKCVFEGLNDPIFYRNFYIKTFKQTDSTNQHDYIYMDKHYATWELYNKNKFYHNYVLGLKYKDSEQDPWKRKQSFELKQKYHNDYLNELLTWFSLLNVSDPGKTWGILTVPSSKTGVTNEVTKLVQELLNNYQLPNFSDFTNNLYRAKDKETAHEGGTRDVTSNIRTLGLKDPNALMGVDNLVLIDDITTTGNSISAVKTFLNNNDINNIDMYNYVFGKTISFEEVLQRDPQNLENPINNNINGTIDGIVFDFDQTLINSQHRNDAFEKKVNFGSELSNLYKNFGDDSHKNRENSKKIYQTIKSIIKEMSDVYELYPEIKSHFSNLPKIPFAIVTNSSKTRANVLAQTNAIQSTLYPNLYNYFVKNTPSSESNDFEFYYNKKLPPYHINYTGYPLKNIYSYTSKGKTENIKKAKAEWFVNKCQVNGRIIGLGNTEEDLIAYHQAGLEACLALWGVHPDLREYAKQHWKYNQAFNNFDSFLSWITNTNMTYQSQSPVVNPYSNDWIEDVPF